jgi:hypothetical protein
MPFGVSELGVVGEPRVYQLTFGREYFPYLAAELFIQGCDESESGNGSKSVYSFLMIARRWYT